LEPIASELASVRLRVLAAAAVFFCGVLFCAVFFCGVFWAGFGWAFFLALFCAVLAVSAASVPRRAEAGGGSAG
jgi:hypothetical protein